MMTEEYMMKRLLAARLDKPPQPAPPPKPAVKAQERWTAPKPREAIAQQAAVSTKALAEAMRKARQDTAESRRHQQEAKELADWNAQDPYQRELDRWWQAKLDVEAEVRALRGEIPERGIYDPMKQFEREMKEGR